MENLFDFTKFSEQFTTMITSYAPKVVGAILTLIIGFWIAGRLTKAVKKLLSRQQVDVSVQGFLGSLVNVGLKVMILLAVAGMFGIETTSFIAIFSALAFAIGLALQGTLGHFASGVMILIFKPYKVGDLVTIGGGQTGAVEEIQIFNTILRTLDNQKIIVPNGVVTSNVITNKSGQGTMGIELSYSISYKADIDKAKQIIVNVAKACPFILDEPAPAAFVAQHGNNAIHLATRPFAKSENYWNAFFYMQEHVKKEFDKAGISIPYPQMDVHMINAN
jgi:small conductance mechanosensitive channel